VPELNNPAERLEYWLLKARDSTTNDQTVRTGMCQVWGLSSQSRSDRAELMRRIGDLLALPAEIRGLAGAAGPMGARFLEHFDQIENATDTLFEPSRQMLQVWNKIDSTGWYSLSLLRDLLSKPASRVDLTDDALALLIAQARELIDALVASDLPVAEREDLVEHIRDVESALIRAQIGGPGEASRAIDGVLGCLVRAYVRGSATAGHPVTLGVVAFMNAVAVALGVSADYLAIEGPLGEALNLTLPGPGPGGS
jgi:hypothetical protein